MNRKLTLSKQLIFIMTMIPILFLSSCGKQDESDENKGMGVYAVSKDETKVAVSEYLKDASLVELIDELQKQPEDVSLSAPISDRVKLSSYEKDGDTVKVSFDPSYMELSRGREVLTRAAIVRTLCAADDVNYVEFFIGNDPLVGYNGAVIGPMTPDMFIDNAGNEINIYEKVSLTLYFTDETGERLREIHRNCVYNSNISTDKLVVEELIKGPEEADAGYVYPTINPLTKVISVTTSDGTCYVNLDSAFLVKQGNASPEATIYSIVNSLVEQPNINKVQISVDGNSEILFMEAVPLSQIFERNLEIMNVQ